MSRRKENIAVINYDFIKPTPRKSITAKERASIFLLADGICHMCSLKIRPGQEWDVSHPEVGLWAGGSDDRSTLKPAHRKCHRAYTNSETTQRAKEKRVREKHLGAFKKSGQSFSANRNSKFKKKLDGTIEIRNGK